VRLSIPTQRGSLAGVRLDPAVSARGTVILVPGFTGSKEDFIAVFEPLVELGWSVVSYDQLGQHESAGPDDETAYALDLFAQDLLDVVSEVATGPVHVVGHSFGGLVGRHAALIDGGASFTSLTLFCTGPGPISSTRHDDLNALVDALPHTPLPLIYQIMDTADRASGWEPPSQEVADMLEERFLANSPHGLRSKAAILLTADDRTDELVALAQSGLPIWVVYGENDDAWPTAEQDQVAAALGVPPVVIPNAAHSPNAENPLATAKAWNELFSR
jgi:pimeloyl-ACP methyl ester carboxylesterase